MTERDALIAANAAFYAAFAAGDIEEVVGLWADDDGISCVHPGWPPIIGHATVIGSWRDILGNPDRPDIVCVEPYAIVDGECGRVLCIEIVNGTALAACNNFRRIGNAWRLVHHQSSPIAEIVTAANDDGASHRVH